MDQTLSIAIHGGAGTISKNELNSDLENAYKQALKKALDAGYDVLYRGESSLKAVETAVLHLEDSPLFNAGKGSVFTNNGIHEMDASIMEGGQRMAGAVAGVQHVKNPIKLARLILEKSEHVFLAGDGALQFAKEMGLSLENDTYFYDEYRYKQWRQALKKNITQLDHTPLDEQKYGTVGAVARDKNGNLAAATSTGGLTNKKYNRVGDSALIGSGTYANNQTCAVSCTGSGEFFIRSVTAFDLSALIEHKNYNLQKAADEVVFNRLQQIGGDGGLVAIDRNGTICMTYNTDGMYRAAKNNKGLYKVAIYD